LDLPAVGLPTAFRLEARLGLRSNCSMTNDEYQMKNLVAGRTGPAFAKMLSGKRIPAFRQWQKL
jgi:hypothetical protein